MENLRGLKGPNRKVIWMNSSRLSSLCCFLSVISCSDFENRNRQIDSAAIERQDSDRCLEDFLSAVSGSRAMEGQEIGVHVDWNYSGAIKYLWGENVVFRFSDLGCELDSPLNNIYCVLNRYDSLFGINTGSDDLVLLYESMDGNYHNFSFFQAIYSIPVYSSGVRVVLTENDSAISAVFSSSVSGAYSSTPRDFIYSAFLADRFPGNINNAISEVIGGYFTITDGPEINFEINKRTHDFLAVPIIRAMVMGSNGRQYSVRTSISYDELLEIEEAEKSTPGTIVRSRTAYRNYSDDSCTGRCFIGFDYCLEDPYTDPNICVDRCNDDCETGTGMDEMWECDQNQGEFYLTCFQPSVLYLNNAVSIYDTVDSEGWQGEGYEYWHYFLHAVEMAEALSVYLSEDGPMNRDGWDDQGSPFYVHLYPACTESCESIARGRDGYIKIIDWDDCLEGSWELGNKYDYGKRYVIFGHEATHSVTQSIAGDLVSDDECVSENMSDLLGSLFARSIFSEEYWEEDCIVTANRTMFMDMPCGNLGYDECNCNGTHHTGLTSNEGHAPYSTLRSFYDALPCPGDFPIPIGGSCSSDTDCAPYQRCETGIEGYRCRGENGDKYYNAPAWMRFGRLLSEGSSTFTRDGYNEDVGVSYNGVGNALAAEIVTLGLETALDNNPEATRMDVVDGLVYAGSQKNKASEVRYSLGAIGFPGATYYTGASTDKAPRVVYWDEWTQAYKDFTVYKADGSGNVVIRYHNGTQYTTTTITGANAAESPTAVVFNGKLHIFWRDSADNSIMMRYYNNDLSYSQYDLASLSLTTAGAFDAIVFQGDLYLGFVKSSTITLHIARCIVSSGGCDSSSTSWQGYGNPVVRYLNTNYSTGHGIGLASGANINGSGESEYLFALLTHPVVGNDYARLKVLRVNSSDQADGLRWLNSTYPSYRADLNLPRGLEVRESAFSGSPFNEGKYLYLAWNDYEGDRVYVSVLKDWSYQTSVGWFTRSFPIFSTDEATTDGVTIKRGDSTATRYLYKTSSDYGYYKVVYQLY